MASPRVFEVGIGVFILAVLWTTCCLLCIFLSKTQGISRAVGVFAVALLATVLLLVLPQGEGQKPKDSDITDSLFIWRITLTVLLGVCALASPMIMIKVHWSVPVQARSLNRLNNIIRRRTVSIQTSEEQL
ncbi:transmembrane protein 218-like [Rhipicephalus sanguineus]|uniref:transmembrane protein 218-like n=1 Tax=Rhipicephalus sanguineus TaxID=34632 RepID=UPI0020C46928|nr:transmembrane protein 218-like [Rhipicephalus sanguineus]